MSQSQVESSLPKKQKPRKRKLQQPPGPAGPTPIAVPPIAVPPIAVPPIAVPPIAVAPVVVLQAGEPLSPFLHASENDDEDEDMAVQPSANPPPLDIEESESGDLGAYRCGIDTLYGSDEQAAAHMNADNPRLAGLVLERIGQSKIVRNAILLVNAAHRRKSAGQSERDLELGNRMLDILQKSPKLEKNSYVCNMQLAFAVVHDRLPLMLNSLIALLVFLSIYIVYIVHKRRSRRDGGWFSRLRSRFQKKRKQPESFAPTHVAVPDPTPNPVPDILTS